MMKTIGWKQALAVTTYAALTWTLSAQTADRPFQSAHRYVVKLDRGGDFEAAVKEYAALLKKAGSERPFVWYQAMSGRNEFVLVRWHAKMSETDPANREAKLKDVGAELARIADRAGQCADTVERRISEVVADASLPRLAVPAPMLQVTRNFVKPGQTQAYLSLVKQDILPAMKSAGVKTYVVYQLRHGGSPSEIVSSRSLSAWTDLDEPHPLSKAMGEEKLQRFQQRRAALLDGSESQIYRYRADMSYLPPQ